MQKEIYLKWLRHPEYHTLESVFPAGEPYMLYRGLKSILHVVKEITENDGKPAKGAVWITNNYDYAVKFGPAYTLHISPVQLSMDHAEIFIPDKPDTFTTGKPINVYACMFKRSKINLLEYLLAHFPELKEKKMKIMDVLNLKQ
ncbi:MAG: hypothetical protein KDK38_02235 [Leptospiraceae bacterium]|nr:hypothetical protein [Leptospiraceae bacterium]